MDFRAYARTAADMHGEDYTGVEPAEATPGTGDPSLPSSCSYCGGTYFEPPEDNGQVRRAECEECGGTMVAHPGGTWQPDLIGSPHNHPKMNADPRSGGVGGAGAVPVKTREEDLSSRTAGANGELPEGFRIEHQNYKPGDDEHNDLDSNLPGWQHRLIRAHVDERPDEVGRLEYSVSPEDHEIKIHETRVHSRYQRRGIGSAMNAELVSRYPHHEIDRGPATEDGEEFRQGLDKAAGVDWCRHRHAEHCWLPRQEPAAVALFVPQDRGVCPWTTASMQQINCPMSEPGPMAGMTRAAAWTDPEWRFHVFATWRDVRAKATRIRREGGVNIISSLVDGITGHVNGDTGVYETQINYVPGSFKIGYWQCGCAWASYAWGRSPSYQRFEGRMCSHALALTYEAQSRGMFGREVKEDTERPGWMRDKVRVRHDRVTRDHDVRAASLQAGLDPDGVYPTETTLSLDRRPIEAFAADAYAARNDPADVMRVYLAAGLDHEAARDLLLDGINASIEQWGVMLDRYPELRATVDLGDYLITEAAKDDEPTPPTHAGVVLKAADTGRILMIQRSHQDENDPAAGTWEFPGGGREEGDDNSLHSGIREFEEEVGHEFPTGGTVSHVWRSPNGVYQGHVVVVPHEKVIDFSGGRRTVNPDDPDGDDHEQSAWWDPDHARKNPALRPECKDSPWDKIKAAAALTTTADYSSHDELGDLQPDWRPKTPPKAQEPGQAENPGSTGFATSQDPPEWENASQRAETMSMSMWSSLGELHDEPEPALPSTTAEDEVEEPGERFRSQMTDEISPTEDLLPSDGRTAGISDAVARFQASAGFKALQSTEGPSDMDIATAARQHLTGGPETAAGIRTIALKDFSAAEQAELIGEGRGELARNFGDLKIEGTHYEALSAAIAKETSLADPDDLFD